MESANLPWDNMTEIQQAPYQVKCKSDGMKCAILMTLGQHIPMYLFILILIGLLNRTITDRFRIFLRYAFWCVWLLGIVFLALGSGYWGVAIAGEKVREA